MTSAIIIQLVVRRLSALFFLFGMMALLLFQQPVFAYCGHTHQFFINDCGCEKQVESGCPHCLKDQPSDPCDDCSEKIQLDVDELVWFDLTVEAPAMICSPVVDGTSGSLVFPSASEGCVTPIRPPPPPRSLSLFLLHSVFRL